jgi:uncharacterized protein (TIGR03118 family)
MELKSRSRFWFPPPEMDRSPTGLNGPGTPTGIVFNGSSTDFQVQGKSANFIFAALDGTISAWAPGVNKNQSIIVVDNSANKAMYTGLAITSNASGNFLYAADNTNNHIDMFDGTFTLVKSFGDPAIPSTFSVFGVQDINGLVYVTYAVPNVGAGGYVDVFKEDGTFVKTLIQGLPLNQAWGVAAAPPNFGPLSNTLLVSNNSVSRHHQCVRSDYREVCRHDQRPARGKIVLNNLWGIAFGGGTTANGAPTSCSSPWVRGLAPPNWPAPLQKSSSILLTTSLGYRQFDKPEIDPGGSLGERGSCRGQCRITKQHAVCATVPKTPPTITAMNNNVSNRLAARCAGCADPARRARRWLR